MDANELIRRIAQGEKRTPVKLYLWESGPTAFPGGWEFPAGPGTKLVFGDWEALRQPLKEQREQIAHMEVECLCRRSAIPLLDLRDVNARVEPGAVIREGVEIGEGAVVMMGAIVNIGAVIGRETMIDMGAVLGGRAMVGARCHIGAGAVLAGVIEPVSAKSVVIEDDVLVGANAVVLEGCRVGRGAVVAAGAVVTRDVPPQVVVAGCPARIVKEKDAAVEKKTELVAALR